MINKTISIPYEIHLKLKEEDNASGLITSLLVDYYRFNRVDLDTIRGEIDQIKHKKRQYSKEIKSDLKKLEEVESSLEEKGEEEVEVEKATEDKKLSIKKRFGEVWLEEKGEEPEEDIFEEFWGEFNNPLMKTNIYSFIEDHG